MTTMLRRGWKFRSVRETRSRSRAQIRHARELGPRRSVPTRCDCFHHPNALSEVALSAALRRGVECGCQADPDMARKYRYFARHVRSCEVSTGIRMVEFSDPSPQQCEGCHIVCRGGMFTFRGSELAKSKHTTAMIDENGDNWVIFRR